MELALKMRNPKWHPMAKYNSSASFLNIYIKRKIRQHKKTLMRPRKSFGFSRDFLVALGKTPLDKSEAIKI